MLFFLFLKNIILSFLVMKIKYVYVKGNLETNHKLKKTILNLHFRNESVEFCIQPFF